MRVDYLALRVGDVVPSERKREAEVAVEATNGVRVWVVVVSKPGQERLARYNLQEQGFEPYLPMRLAFNRKKQELVQLPFFPRYLFAHTGLLMSDWGKIWNTRGVHGVLGHADRPVGVRDELVDKIRSREVNGYLEVGLESDERQFEPGDRVRTADEIEFEGVFEEKIDDRRAVILVSFLGRDSRFTVDLRKLRSAEGF